MNDLKIPYVYQKMIERGYVSGSGYLWFDKMEWLPMDKILGYEYDVGETRSIVPFAITGGGDKWVWVTNSSNSEYPVGICWNEEVDGIYYAKNMEDAVLKQIIEFVSDSVFYTKESDADKYDYNQKELTLLLRKWENSFNGIIKKEYINLIHELSEMKLKHVSSQYGEWEALLSYDESRKMIKEYLNFELVDKTFEWYTI